MAIGWDVSHFEISVKCMSYQALTRVVLRITCGIALVFNAIQFSLSSGNMAHKTYRRYTDIDRDTGYTKTQKILLYLATY